MTAYELPDGRKLKVFPGGYKGGYFVGWETSNGYRKQFKSLGSHAEAAVMQERLERYMADLKRQGGNG